MVRPRTPPLVPRGIPSLTPPPLVPRGRYDLYPNGQSEHGLSSAFTEDFPDPAEIISHADGEGSGGGRRKDTGTMQHLAQARHKATRKSLMSHDDMPGTPRSISRDVTTMQLALAAEGPRVLRTATVTAQTNCELFAVQAADLIPLLDGKLGPRSTLLPDATPLSTPLLSPRSSLHTTPLSTPPLSPHHATPRRHASLHTTPLSTPRHSPHPWSMHCPVRMSTRGLVS